MSLSERYLTFRVALCIFAGLLLGIAVNDLVMVVAFAPGVAVLPGVTDMAAPWQTLILSVVLSIVIAPTAGAITRQHLVAGGGEATVSAFTARITPASILGPSQNDVRLCRRSEAVLDLPDRMPSGSFAKEDL